MVWGAVSEEKIKWLEKGVELEDGKTAPCQIQIFEKSSTQTSLFVTLHEGKKRQIRRLFDKIGHRVTELERLSYGSLTLCDLRFGQKRELKPYEIKLLKPVA